MDTAQYPAKAAPAAVTDGDVNARRIGGMVVLVLMLIFGIACTTIPDGNDGMVSMDDLAIDKADTAWMLTSASLVLFMTPGLAFFYGGMVRQKNLISTLLMSVFCMGSITLLWIIVGFSLAFGENALGGIIGNPATYFLHSNVGAAPDEALSATIPATVYSGYQLTFAIITAALITGAVVERCNFNALALFLCIWHLAVYCPMAHMEWGPGGLFREKFAYNDFAGGTVVHMSSGYSAVTLALLLGKRSDHSGGHHKPAHIPYVILGTAMLWFGWFGFNAGSALGATSGAAQAWMVTNTGAASGAVAWVMWDYVMGRKPTAMGCCGGIVVGLVAVTPGSGYVTVGAAIIIAMISCIISNIVQQWFKHWGKVDDVLDVFPCHGVGGTSGMILTSLFSTEKISGEGSMNGLFYGEGELFWHTLVVAVGLIVWFVVFTVIIFYIVNAITPMRVSEEDQLTGLDHSKHGEMGFATGAFGSEGSAIA